MKKEGIIYKYYTIKLLKVPSIPITILGTLITCLIIFYIILKIKERQINKLEDKIKKLFIQRTDFVPALFEISKNNIVYHQKIFSEILKLRKIEFLEESSIPLFQILSTKKLIHYEINFIFKVSNKHQKLIRKGKFIYLRNLIIEKSYNISEEIKYYKQSIDIFNKLINIKNFTIIGFLLPLKKKVNL